MARKVAFACAFCGKLGETTTSAANRAARGGSRLFCGRECSYAMKRTGRTVPDWSQRRFEQRSTAVEVACAGCQSAMWLPKSKVRAEVHCSVDCLKRTRELIRSARERRCDVCDSAFFPRPAQIALGEGRYCSRRCFNSLGNISSPANLALAVQGRRTAIAEGRIVYPKGSDNPLWKGGKEAAYRRAVASGRNAERLRNYRKANPHKVKEFHQRRKGRKVGRLPRGTIAALLVAQRRRCAICQTGIAVGYQVDHIQPLARGGTHEPRNLQLLCKTCNVRKSARDPLDYMRLIGRLL